MWGDMGRYGERWGEMGNDLHLAQLEPLLRHEVVLQPEDPRARPHGDGLKRAARRGLERRPVGGEHHRLRLRLGPAVVVWRVLRAHQLRTLVHRGAHERGRNADVRCRRLHQHLHAALGAGAKHVPRPGDVHGVTRGVLVLEPLVVADERDRQVDDVDAFASRLDRRVVSHVADSERRALHPAARCDDVEALDLLLAALNQGLHDYESDAARADDQV